MAKETKDGKIQFVFVNVEGDQETLQETLRQIGTVLNRGMNPPAKTLIAVPTPKALQGTISENGTGNQLYEVKEEQQKTTEHGDTSVDPAENVKQKRVKRVSKAPPLLKDVDLTSGEVSFKDFVHQKDVSNHFNKYLVIAAWFKRYQGVDEITTSHIYTCYQFMKWQGTDNIAQPFRDMKARHSYFDKGSKPSAYAINLIGLNEVDGMTPKSAE